MRAVLVIAIGAAGCTGASPSLALDLPIQLVGGGQFRPGPFPAAGAGPAALDLVSLNQKVAKNQLTERLSGHLAPTARTAIIGLGLDPVLYQVLGIEIVTLGTIVSLDGDHVITVFR